MRAEGSVGVVNDAVIATSTPLPMDGGWHAVLDVDGIRLRDDATDLQLCDQHPSGNGGSAGAIGKIRNLRADDGKYRGRVELTIEPPTSRGREIWEQWKNGHNTSLSIGFRPVETMSDNENKIVTITHAVAYEASVVPLPMDTNCGVNRREANMPAPTNNAPAETPAQTTTTAAPAIDETAARTTALETQLREMRDETARLTAAAAAEKDRVTAIRAQAERFIGEAVKAGNEARANKIREAESKALAGSEPFARFSDELLTIYAGEGHGTIVQEGDAIDPSITGTLGRGLHRDIGRYSMMRAAAAASGQSKLEGIELECQQEMITKNRCTPNGAPAGNAVAVPIEVLMPGVVRSMMPGNPDMQGMQRRNQVVGTPSAGGAFVEDTHYDDLFTSYLYEQGRIMGNPMFPIQSIMGATGNIIIPIQNGSHTAYWVGEVNAVTKSLLSVTTSKMTPNRIGALSHVSTQSLLQTEPGMENLVRNDLAEVHAQAIEDAILNGNTTSNANTIQGLLQINNTQPQVHGTNGGAVTWSTEVAARQELIEANITGPYACLHTPGINSKKMTTQQFAGSNGVDVSTAVMHLGIGSLESNLLPTNLEKGSSGQTLHAQIYAAWRWMVFAMWGSVTLKRDEQSIMEQGLVRLYMESFCDMALRRPNAFVVSKDISVA